MLGLLIAATLAGQTPVDRMTSLCAQSLEDPVGQRYLNGPMPMPWEKGYDEVLSARLSALRSTWAVRAHSEDLDPSQTRRVCEEMIFQRVAGRRDQLGQLKFVVTTE